MYWIKNNEKQINLNIKSHKLPPNLIDCVEMRHIEGFRAFETPINDMDQHEGEVARLMADTCDWS